MTSAPIIHLNGSPGVGKLTTARHLSPLLGARIVDNHTIYNPAFALAEFRTPAFFDAVRQVRDVIYRLILRLPPMVPVILTDAYFADSEWGRENWQAILDLARQRDAHLFAVTLTCSREEHQRRIVDVERDAKGKIRDPNLVDGWTNRPLVTGDTPFCRAIDVTHLAPETIALDIAAWVSAHVN
jgi:predicted kinase